MDTKAVWETDINGEGMNNIVGHGKLSNLAAGRSVAEGVLSLWIDIVWIHQVPIEIPGAYARNAQSLHYKEQTTIADFGGFYHPVRKVVTSGNEKVLPRQPETRFQLRPLVLL